MSSGAPPPPPAAVAQEEEGYDKSRYEKRLTCDFCRVNLNLCVYEIGKPFVGCQQCLKPRGKPCVVQNPKGCKSDVSFLRARVRG